jgi:hypothetical protein
MRIYEQILVNPQAKVTIIRNNGRFQVYGCASDEYREFMLGLTITTNENQYD